MFTKLLIPLLLIVGSLVATPDLCHPLTLPELINIALENHPSTKQAWWNAQRAAAFVGSAKSAYYPQLNLEGSIINGRDFKFINGPDVDYTIVGADLYLSMLLYDFGERSANVCAAKSALIAANWQVDWNIQRVMVQVLENAYSMLHAQETLQATHCSLGDAEKVMRTARELNRTGLTPISDVYTSQASFAQMKMDFAQQKALLDIQKGKLITSLGLSADTNIALAPIKQLPAPQKQQLTDLISISYQQRADLMARQARLEETIFQEKSANAAYRPKVLFDGRGGANHAIHDKANAAQYQVALRLEIPLFNGFEPMYNNRIAFTDTQIATEDLLGLQLEISMEVLTYSRSLEAAQEMLPDAEESLNNAQKAYESVLEKYKAGEERIAEVSNAQRQLAAARIRYSDVKTRWLISIANLAYATGTLAPYMETPCEKY